MDNRKVILFYNKMWNEPLNYPEEDLPQGYVITTDRSMMEQAVAVVFHIPSLPSDFITHRKLLKNKGQLWVAWSMECEAHYPQMADPVFMDHFDLTMTYNPESDVFTPYALQNFIELIKRPVSEKPPGNTVDAFISSNKNKSGRVQLLMQLMGRLKVHSYGQVLNTKSLQSDEGLHSKLDAMSTYKFTLAFENAVARDYVTEKFYEPLVAGSVPVYLGAPNIDDYSPGEKCFIDASKWDNPQDLADYLLELSDNDDMYNGYFEWRGKPLKKKFTDLLDLKKEHEFVRLCKKIDEMI